MSTEHVRTRCASTRIGRRWFTACVALLVFMSGWSVRGPLLHAQQPPAAAKRAAADSAKKTAADTIKKAVLVPKPPAADSAAALGQDSARNARAQARIDSIAKFEKGDTIKSPLAHFEKPDVVEASDRLHFSRAQILSTGAVNVADLLDRVPGATSFRTGWLSGIHTVAYNGDFRRVRVFFDGVERDAVESRNGGILDLVDIPLATLDEVTIERTAGEIRVWLRGWTVQRTTAFTRVDIFTGDLNTNGFRGLFAKRFRNGFSFQFLGQQAATQSGRVSAFSTSGLVGSAGDGTQQLIDTRLGWARGRLTIDVQGTGIARDRDAQLARRDFTDLPKYKGGRREGYARVAYGDSARGWFSQALIGVLRTSLQGIADTTSTSGTGGTGGSTTTDSTATAVVLDTIRSRTQQIFTIGYRSATWHASVIDRIRPVAGTSFHAPAVRLGIGNSRYQVAAYGERRALDSLTYFDVSAMARPRSWLTLTASHAQRSADSATLRGSSAYTRADAFFKLRRYWLSAGIAKEGLSSLTSPILLGAPEGIVSASPSTGLVGSLRGPVYKAINLDVQVTRWDAAQYYRPRLDVRSELSLTTDWLRRFPKGEFGINVRVIHESRDPVPFFWTANGKAIQRATEPSQVVTALLEIRIQSATLFYQFRNLTGQAYEQIPGLTMPPQVQMYGVRWEFWN